MSDNREAYPIQWNAPAPQGAAPSWNGPRPDAQLPPRSAAPAEQPDGVASAPQGYPSSASAPLDASGQGGARADDSGDAPRAAEPLGWAGAASARDTAQEISRSHPQDAGYGWSGAGGSSRFDAPDRDDHAPRQTPAQPQQPAVEDGLAGRESAAFAPAPQQPEAPAVSGDQPSSYSPAPQSGSTGSPAHEPWGGASYESAPPQVVGQHDDLPEDSLTIGRSRVNSIVLDDMLVSRRHVVITADDEGLLLRDLGSRNGTFVNGRRVEQTHLHEGDRIGIGASTFEVRDGWLVSV